MLVAILVASSTGATQQQPPFLVAPVLFPALVTWDPVSLVNGAPCLFRVKPSVSVKSLTGLWLTRTVPFELDPADGSWFAFAGVGLNVSEGEYPLDLEGIGNDGLKVSFRANVTVGRGSYRTVDLRVADRFTAPSAATRVRIEREQKLKADVFSQSTAQRLWAGRFAPPLDSSATDSFGVRRTFNGVRASIRAPTTGRRSAPRSTPWAPAACCSLVCCSSRVDVSSSITVRVC